MNTQAEFKDSVSGDSYAEKPYLIGSGWLKSDCCYGESFALIDKGNVSDMNSNEHMIDLIARVYLFSTLNNLDGLSSSGLDTDKCEGENFMFMDNRSVSVWN